MNWIALIMALLPLIEMLLKLFQKRRDGAVAARLRAALAQCDEAEAKLSPADRTKHRRLLSRLARARAKAKELNIVK